jgi:hypothetical protein
MSVPSIGERLMKIPIDEPLPAVPLCVVTRRELFRPRADLTPKPHRSIL